MSKNSLAITILAIISCSATAQYIDVGSAATGALVTVLIRGAIAFCLFKFITLNLTRKNIDTPIKTGRWVGSWLMGISILSNPSLHKSDIDFYVGTAIMAVVWFVIGFGIGFVWRKFKPFNSVVPTHKLADVDDERLWEQASAELNSPNKNEGLWTKCFAEANGDEAKAKAQYLNIAVKKIKYSSSSIQPNQVSDNKRRLFVGIGALLVVLVVVYFAINSNNKSETFIKPLNKVDSGSKPIPSAPESAEQIKNNLMGLNLVRGIKNAQLLNAHKLTLQSLSDTELKELIVIGDAQKNGELLRQGKVTLDELTLKQLLELKAVQQAYANKH